MQPSQKQPSSQAAASAPAVSLDPRFATREEVSLVLDWISVACARLEAVEEVVSLPEHL